MSVIKIQEIHEGRDGTADHSKSIVHKYSRHWRVWTSSVYDGAYTVLAACPVLPGQVHPEDPIAVAGIAKCENDRRAKKVWLLHVDYSSEGSQPSGNKQSNPLSDLPEIEWSTDTTQVPFNYDKDGVAILNSAGDPFENGVKDDQSYWVVTGTKNFSFIPLWIDQYRDAVNSDAVLMDGVYFQPGQLKIKSIKIGKWQNKNGYWYRAVTLQIKVRDAPPSGISAGDFTNVAGNDWRHYVLDQGTRKNDPTDATKRLPCHNDDGSFATKPKLLNGSGEQIVNPSTSNAKFLCVDLCNSKPFSFLQ